MKLLLGVTLIVLVALLGSRWTFTRIRLPRAAQNLYLTGTEFILVGLALGPLLLGILDQETMRGLRPLLDLAMGWIGLLFGTQLERRRLSQFPHHHLVVALVQSAATFLVCCAAFIPLLDGLDLAPAQMTMHAALGLAAMAIPTAQSSLALIHDELGARPSPVMTLLRYVSGVDAVLALAVFGVLFSLPHATSPIGLAVAVPVQLIVLSAGLGVVLGVVLHLLTRMHCRQEELMLFTVGIVAFGAGAAAYIRVSTLFATMVAGLLVANLRGAGERISRAMVALEKPLYLIVLLFGGALLSPGPQPRTALALAGLYVLARLAGKAIGGYAGSVLARRHATLPRSVGLGLLSQGGIAAAMALSFQHTFPGPLADTVLLFVMVAIGINELISPALTRRVLTGRPEGGAA